MTKSSTAKEPVAPSGGVQASKKTATVKPKAPVKKAAGSIAPSGTATKATKAAKAAIEPEKKKPAAPAKKGNAAEKKEKVKKPKLVRDSFTMPEAEYKVLGEVKKNCLKAGIEVKKSELLRVGVALIRQMEPGKLQAVLATLPSLKAGRPKTEK
jgi:hypothetical protein